MQTQLKMHIQIPQMILPLHDLPVSSQESQKIYFILKGSKVPGDH